MQRKKLNSWSAVAMLCSIGMCPIFSIASILLGIRAIIDIKAKGDTRGVRLAWFAILIGSLVTGLWGGGMLWWNKNVRSNISHAPIIAIMQAQSDNYANFDAAFITNHSKSEVELFIKELERRYGTLLGGELDKTITDSSVDGNNLFLGMVPIEAELSYVLHFEKDQKIPLVAKFNLFVTRNDASEFTNRFSWFRIKDDEFGDLVFPITEEKKDLHE